MSKNTVEEQKEGSEIEGLSKEQQELAQQLQQDFNRKQEAVEKIQDNKWKYRAIFSLLLAGCLAFGKKSLSIVYAGSIGGIRLVKHFMFHGVKVSMSLLEKLFTSLKSIQGIKTVLTKSVQGTSHTIGSAATAGLVHIFMAILESIGALISYAYNSLWKRNKKYPWDMLVKDLKKIWIGNLIAAAVTTIVAVGLAAILMACSITVAWPFIIAGIAAGIIGSFAKWWYNNRDGNNFLKFPTPFAKTKRDDTYREWAKSDNKKNRISGSGKEEWPEELDDLVWIFESMQCLEFAVKKTLDEDKIDCKYQDKIQGVDKLKGMEKINKKAIWDFRKAILTRYVLEIQNSGTKVEECIVKACDIRHKQIADDCCIL